MQVASIASYELHDVFVNCYITVYVIAQADNHWLLAATTWFNTRKQHVGFVVDKVALVEVNLTPVHAMKTQSESMGVATLIIKLVISVFVR
jgi:hypothetical protein